MTEGKIIQPMTFDLEVQMILMVYVFLVILRFSKKKVCILNLKRTNAG